MQNRFALFSFIWMLAFSTGSEAMIQGQGQAMVRGWHPHPFLSAISSPLGLASVAFTYAVLSGVANWIWAYNWALRANVTAEQNARIQEAGGLSAAAITWVFGGLIPLYAFLYAGYVAQMKRDAANANQPTLEAREDAFVEHVRRESIAKNRDIGS